MRQGFSRRLGSYLLSLGVGLAMCAGTLENALSETATLDDVRRELADLKSDLRALRETDLRNTQAITDLTKRQNRVEDGVKAQLEALQNMADQLQTNVLQWLATLDDKQAAKFRELGKKIDDSFLTQDQRIKKAEQQERESNKQITTHLGEVDQSLLKMSDTIKTVGTKLSTQNEQQAVALNQLEESTKQTDLQLRNLAPRVDQLKISLSELSKAMLALSEKSTGTDRRLTELSGQTESKVGALVVQEAEQAAKMDRLAKRMESEAQAVTAHVNTVTQNVNGMAKSLEAVQARMAQLGSQSAQNENQDARIDALTKTLNATVTTLNESTRSLGDLKQLLEMSVSKLATRIDEQGETLNRVMQRGALDRSGANGHGETASADRKSGAAKAAQDSGLRPEAAYDHAYQDFMQNQYDTALASFQNFLSQFPDSALAPNAHFWIAECYVRKREYGRGIEAYEQVIRNYPRSGKASSALYRKAVVLLGLNDKTGAKSALHQLIADYPKSEESKQARAKLATLQ